ncbi:MAG: 2,4-dihydroxyhept-2-ene-1,7-dioic acid aldolase [Acidiferrobacteraceae bacterium]|nr:2,4-dihydroxyhept-2-ene-1,7-dioic acid aldolase [Acidiferrobacteraceae bacterium]|tara:strand:+ start:39 stop:788 length:750 start_codon:yes stop_codon:yes gene_type:complete
MSKKRLLSHLTIGSWIQIGHPAVAEIMASAGFDWLAVDLEHSAITLREAEDLIRIIDIKGVIPFVRLSSNNPEQIKRVMDVGAHGVIVPMVKTPNEAQRAVKAVKYPPVGERSIGLARAQGYGAKFEHYFDWQAENTYVIVQIEHIKAVENLREILSIPGIDGYIVGPYDLSGSIGKPGIFDDPEFLSAMGEIRRVSNEVGVPGGVHIVEPDRDALKACIDEGNTFIAYGVDTRMLDTVCRDGLKPIRA